MPADDRAFTNTLDMRKAEAAEERDRWKNFHDFKSALARLQAVYCQTVHTAQGSTHGVTFVNVADIRKRKRHNLAEMQRILYAAVTKPSSSLVLLGV